MPIPLLPHHQYRRQVTLSLLGTGLGVLFWLARGLLVSEPTVAGDAAQQPTIPDPLPTVSTHDDSERVHKLLIGKWTIKDKPRRDIENRPDGTAAMTAEIEFPASLRYGRQLELDLSWTVVRRHDDWIMTQYVQGGTPRAGVDWLISDWGAEREYQVEFVSDDSLRLTSLTDGAEYLLQRCSNETAPDAASPVHQ